MIFNKKLIFTKNIFFPLCLSFFVLGCNSEVKNTRDNTNSQTQEKTVETQKNKTSEELLVGYWKMVFDMENADNLKAEGLSEEEIAEIKKQMDEYPVLFQFTEDGKIILSADNSAEKYQIKGDKIKIEDDLVKFVVTETELSLEFEDDKIKFVRSDKETWENANGGVDLSESGIADIQESEAKFTVGAMNRSQQAFFLENSAFATNIDDLQIGIEEESDQYKFSIEAKDQSVYNYGIAKTEEIKSFVGGVFITGETTNSILCIADETGSSKLSPPIIEGDNMSCAKGTTIVE